MPLFKVMMYPFHRRKLNRASEAGRLYQVLIEKDAEFRPSQYNNFFDSLYTIYRPNAPYDWLSMEFWGSASGIRLYTWASGGVSQEFIQSNINSVHPSAEVLEAETDYAAYGRLYGREVACAVLELEHSFLFNLAQADGEREGADLMASLCASMDNLDDDEEVFVQFLLRPVARKAARVAETHFELYKRFGRRPSKLHYPYAVYQPYLEVPKALASALKHTTLGAAGGKEQHQSIRSIQRKLESGVYFDLLVRVVASHKRPIRAHSRLSTVLSAFAPATDKNRLRPYTGFHNRTYFKVLKSEAREAFLKAYESRRVHTYPLENYVTPAELAYLLHYPSKHIKGVVRLRAKKLPVPEGIYSYNSIEDAWRDKAIVFGISRFRGRTKWLAFKDIRMLMQHLYCIGGTGSGKSYWLSFLALQVVRYAGLTFFDVKGDVVDDFLRHLPTSEWDRVLYIDLQDDMRFLPFNILRCRVKDPYDLATMIVDVFVKVFSDGSIKEHSQNVLRQALLAVISADSEGSILEVYRMFTDEGYLNTILKRMRLKTDFPDVLAYWEGYKRMKPSARRSECAAILNKLMLITQNKRPRYTLCQKQNALDWRKLMDRKAIVLVNFSMGQNKDQILEFFGTLFTTFISDATFSRDDTHRDDRVPHFFIVDEFEMFIHQDRDMRKFLEMARSYGLGLGLAHQNVAQITNPALLGTIRDNTFSQVSLLIGDKSAPSVADMFPGVSPEDLTNMEQHTAFGRFKKLSPVPFTFDCPNMSDYFQAVSWEEVKAWKDAYKRKHYKHLTEVKDEIDQRYALVAAAKFEDEETPQVQKGNANGRIRRRGNHEPIDTHTPMEQIQAPPAG